MRKVLIFLLVVQLVTIFFADSAFAQQPFYIDESGNIIHVDSIEQVPMQYRYQFEPAHETAPMDEKARKKYIKELAKQKKIKEKEEKKKAKEREREAKLKEKELAKLRKLAEKEAKKNRFSRHRTPAPLSN